MTKIFILAGEASGDQLGASFVRSYRAMFPDVEFRGVGGPAIVEAGQFESLFPMADLSVMGIAEVVPKLPVILRRLDQVVQAIHGYNPDIVLTIDAPDFSFRVQKRIKKMGIKAKRIHYVAPTVWAWREGRAQKIALFLDGLVCLFPFEPAYFEKYALRSVSVGHPIVHSSLVQADGATFRREHSIADNVKTLGLLFGSRAGEITRHADVMIETAKNMAQLSNGQMHIIVPTLPPWENFFKERFKNFPCPVTVTAQASKKHQAFKACDAALAVSGTVGLELAVAGVPHSILYRMHAVTYHIAKRFIKTPYAHLVNILMQQAVVPEFIQQDAVADKISPVMQKILNDPFERSVQKIAFQMAIKKMQHGENTNAADKAAAFVESFL